MQFAPPPVECRPVADAFVAGAKVCGGVRTSGGSHRFPLRGECDISSGQSGARFAPEIASGPLPFLGTHSISTAATTCCRRCPSRQKSPKAIFNGRQSQVAVAAASANSTCRGTNERTRGADVLIKWFRRFIIIIIILRLQDFKRRLAWFYYRSQDLNNGSPIHAWAR